MPRHVFLSAMAAPDIPTEQRPWRRQHCLSEADFKACHPEPHMHTCRACFFCMHQWMHIQSNWDFSCCLWFCSLIVCLGMFLCTCPNPIPVSRRNGVVQEECRAWDVNEVLFTPALWPTYHSLMRADFTLFDEYEFTHTGTALTPCQCCFHSIHPAGLLLDLTFVHS